MSQPEVFSYIPKKKRFTFVPHYKKPPKPSKRIILEALIGVVLLGGGFAGYSALQKPAPQPTEIENPIPKDVLGLVDTVKKQASLPNETPTVATVSDVKKLQDQIFFKDAKLGDKVLIYAISKRAILYRPSTDKIINQSAVEIATDESATASAQTASTSAEPLLRIKF